MDIKKVQNPEQYLRYTVGSVGADYGLTPCVSLEQAKEGIQEALAAQLDAIIEEVEVGIQTMEHASFMSESIGAKAALRVMLNTLKEAREQLTTNT